MSSGFLTKMARDLKFLNQGQEVEDCSIFEVKTKMLIRHVMTEQLIMPFEVLYLLKKYGKCFYRTWYNHWSLSKHVRAMY